MCAFFTNRSASSSFVKIGAIYQHYKYAPAPGVRSCPKTSQYKVLHLARDCKMLAEYVVYQGIVPPYLTWIRPVNDFTGAVPTENVVDGGAKVVYRFTEISALDTRHCETRQAAIELSEGDQVRAQVKYTCEQCVGSELECGLNTKKGQFD